MKITISATIFLLLITAVTALGQITDEATWDMTRPHEPFRIVGNIYYVGTNDVTAYLITSKDGHILIDSGFEETVPIIEAGIKKLGFRLRDVKILLNNHAHWDHCGGLKTLKDITGAKLYSVRQQADLLASGGSTDFRFGGEQIFKPVKADRIIADGETVSLGGNELLTHLTPGHTKGSTTWTMKVSEGGKVLSVIFLSSTSMLDYDLVSNENYPGIASDYRSTFEHLLQLKPDVFLGSHAGFFNMERKYKELRDGAESNPFIDPEGYLKFVGRMYSDFKKRLDTQQEEKSKRNKE